MSASERASTAFKEGFNCAQAVFATVAPELGLDAETAARAASAFGGGLARTGSTCGAVSGALMAIGLALGSGRPADKEAKEKAYTLAREFIERFRALHESIVCSELLGCDMGTAEGRERAKGLRLNDSICSKLVADSVDILEDMLLP
jgi:C_GCAxxG_C_C family probable redox protein